ncbi:hypothetical protein [Piscirickettsia litoralis]|uniref:Uncharacterized protein n=1 Tax=Piscirickettsia litoralis TaxID=1891921 RepID=A0ABX2ZX01_9GAMM|nr:hypothetical protein [Piscirickettsia litoralis]ODN41126.1 hypothetical protein BGC07_17785 [Piscirickettsia litoralis]
MSDTVIEAIQPFRTRCQHGRFRVDHRMAYVECGICGEKINPMWALHNIAKQESRYSLRLDSLNAQSEKAALKNRCKCQHCGKMTKIAK